MELRSPFPVAGYFGSKYFCDREEETERILDAMAGNRNLTLFSLRRLGKTGLIHHVFSKLSAQKVTTVYIDLLHTQNLNEFINLTSSAILQDVPQKSSFGKAFFNWLKSLRPVISYDNLTGEPKVSIELSKTQDKEQTLRSLMQFLNERKEKVVIAFDEFQQILNYPEKNTEALLRAEIQKLKNTNFIFSGSQQHLIISMFTESKRPFFSSTQMLKLYKLDHNIYKKFIKKQFKPLGSIPEEIIDRILDWTKSHTFYTQFVCNRLYLAFDANKKTNPDSLLFQILKEYEPIFNHYKELLTAGQWQLLNAIAKEDRLYHPQSKEFIQKHKLGTPASVSRALDALLYKEMIYKETDEEGKTFYEIYDVFLSRWMERL
jgi:uncharacterized protein